MSDSSVTVVMSEATSSKSSGENTSKKTCVDCGTTKTPLWRSGPSGPKSLCNACGIRSRKKRRDSACSNKGSSSEKKSKKANGINTADSKLTNGLKRRLMSLGNEAWVQDFLTEKLWKKMAEEEQAALLLMALSCGPVCARF